MFKVVIDLSDLKRIKEALSKAKPTRSDLKKTGDAMVRKMKSQIAVGLSPIAGKGRFPAYKHAGVKGKYPQNVQKRFPAKKARPVNLNLSGQQLKSLESRASSSGVTIGYFNGLAANKEQGHRDGVNKQPKRPTIPEGSENFNESINDVAETILANVIEKKIKV